MREPLLGRVRQNATASPPRSCRMRGFTGWQRIKLDAPWGPGKAGVIRLIRPMFGVPQAHQQTCEESRPGDLNTGSTLIGLVPGPLLPVGGRCRETWWASQDSNL